MLYMKIDKATGAKIAGPQKYDGQPANPDHKPHAWVLLVKVAAPDYDPETQRLAPYQRYDGGEWRVGHDVEALAVGALAAMRRERLSATDKSMARVTEDLIATLIAKGVIALSDLPQAAQARLAERQALR